MNPKILIGHPISLHRELPMRAHFDIQCITERKHKYEAILEQIAEFDALLAISHKVDQKMIDKAPKLRIIANYGVGYDNIDVDYAVTKNIAVTNTPHSTAIPTATHTMGLILSLLRKITLNDRRIRSGTVLDWSDRQLMGTSLSGKILGIIGMGRIGRIVAQYAQAFDMKVIYHNRQPLIAENGIPPETYRTLPALLSGADIISIHTPLNDTTKDLIGEKEIVMMKRHSFLINTSRGGVIHMPGLLHALATGELAGAALDVFPNEPNIPDALLKMDQVVLTPHTGTATKEDREAMFAEAWKNIVNFLLDSGPVSYVV